MRIRGSGRRAFALVLAAAAALLVGAANRMIGVCGPFGDVSDAQFCPFVLEIFTLGITTGTTPATYDPASPVSRLQMAAFLSRTVDGVLRRGNRRAPLGQFWTTQNATVLGLTTVGSIPGHVASDGKDLWVADSSGGVFRVRASDGKLVETWSGANGGYGVVVAMGRVFVTGQLGVNGFLYRIDPGQPAGSVTTVASNLGKNSNGIAFDGTRIWTSNFGTGGPDGSVSIITPGATIPWTVTTVTTGFTQGLGAVFDGANVWIADGSEHLFKLDANAAILQTVTVEIKPQGPVFDGTSIWVPNLNSDSVSVVRASNGAVLATLTGNGLKNPGVAAFDGQRVLVTNVFGESVSLWKAADLSPLGSFPTGTGTFPFGACSDGINFWITFQGTGKLARF